MQALLDDGISTRRGVMNAHRAGLSGRNVAYGAGAQSRTKRRSPGHGRSPLFHDLDEGDQDRVIDAVTRAVSAHE